MNRKSLRALSWTRHLSILGMLAVSWCVMTITHETGHLIGGALGGGVLQFVELRPWRFPQSHFDPDPFPLVTSWCGPLFGIALPMACWILIRRRAFEFIASFCLLANGTYLAAGWIVLDRHLDTTRLLEQGTPPLGIATFCLITIAAGYRWFRRTLLEMSSLNPKLQDE